MLARGVGVPAAGGKVLLSHPVCQDIVQDHSVCTLACMEEPGEPVFHPSTLVEIAGKVLPLLVV